MILPVSVAFINLWITFHEFGSLSAVCCASLLLCFSAMTQGEVGCCRLCSALGVPATDQASHTAKTLREKLDALKAEVG